MFLAAKVEEIVAPSTINFLYCADSSYTEAEVLQAEKYILKTLEWNMNYANPIHLLHRVSKADDNVQMRTVAKYFMGIKCRMETHRHSTISIGCVVDVVSSHRARERGLGMTLDNVLPLRCWNDVLPSQTPNLAHYSSYAESAIIPMANLMINYVLKPVRHGSFFKKYAAKKFMKLLSHPGHVALTYMD